jgi:folate-binding Fe-S cluster repair protein YgfZ
MDQQPPAALLAAMRAAGAVTDDTDHAFAPCHFGDPLAEYHTVLRGAGLLVRSDRAAVIVEGTDRVSWLQGMVTNDVTLLDRGVPALSACLLNATGHVLADVRIAPHADALLLDCPRSALRSVTAVLDRLIVMEDVALRDASTDLVCLSLQGPQAGADSFRRIASELALTVPADHTGYGGIDLWIAADQAARIWT